MDRKLIRKKLRKYKTITEPRYLWGSIQKNRILQDLQLYNMHRRKVFEAKCTINSTAPSMHPDRYFNLGKLSLDAERLKNISKENKILLTKINLINRYGGRTDCWNTKVNNQSKWDAFVQRKRAIFEFNQAFHKKLIEAKSVYSRNDYMQNWHEYVVPTLSFFAKYPLIIFDKKSVDQIVAEQPSIGNGLPILTVRPKAYMTFKMKDAAMLGQIVIELFSDYCPKTVENFLALCKSDDPHLRYLNCKVYNSKKGQFFETGDVVKNNGHGGASIFGTLFKEEQPILKHSRQGVVSMVRTPGCWNDSRFSITMTAMPEFDGKRVAFGQIIRGNETICKINDMSRAIGCPIVPIVITKCGQVPDPFIGIKRKARTSSQHKNWGNGSMRMSLGRNKSNRPKRFAKSK